MAGTAIRTEELAGFGVAVLLHAALLAALLVDPEPEIVLPVTPVTVSLAEDIGLEATAPEPVPESRAAMAPTLSDLPASPDNAAAIAPLPEPVPTAAPPSTRRTATRPAADPRPRRRPDRPNSRPKPTPTKNPTSGRSRGGASRINDNFLGGAGSSTTTNETRAPARTFGRAEQAALSQAINRALSPKWQGKAPQGLEAEKLVTIVRWRMNKDGSLAGRPTVVRQTGITDSNRPQADRHAEAAIRAVQLAAPFKLPPEFYDKWKYISEWRFDRRL